MLSVQTTLAICIVAIFTFHAGHCAETNALNYLGQVDGKIFFVETSPERTWEEAKQICANAGMSLASIESTLQNNFLLNAENSATFPGSYYWTSGRDARTISRFAWDKNGERPITSAVSGIEFEATIDRKACLIYRNFPSNEQFVGLLCDDTYGTLCELQA